MAQKTLNASAFSATQGWYSASGSTSGSGGTITMNFSTDLTAFRKQIDVNNITITGANLYVDCSKSGADRKKKFRLRMYKDSTLLHDFGTELYSTDYAFQANDVKISLASGLSGVLSWIKTGTKITSVDPQTNQHFDLSGSATCSYNYVRLTGAHIVIDYTVNKSSLSNPPTTLTLGNTASFTISGSSEYTNELTLTVGNQSQTLLSNKTIGTFTSNSLNLSLAKGISSTATSGKGTLTLTTYNGDASIGSNTYTVTVKTNSSCAPTATFSITTDPTYWLTGESSPVFNVSGSSNYGATISNYKIYIGSQEYTATSGSNLIKISDKNPTGAQAVKLVITDSRGYTKESFLSGTRYICKYSLPSLNVINFFRSNSSGTRDDVDGTSCFVEYTTTYTNPIYNKSGTSVTPTISVCAIIGNSEVTLTNEKGIIPNTVFEKSKGYIIKFKITDKTTGFSYTTKDYSLQSSAFLLQFRKNQNSVGIGIVAQDLTNLKDPEGKPYSGLVSVGWDTIFSKSVTIPKLKLNNALQLTQGGTEAKDQPGAWNKIVAPGGIFTGDITANKTLTVNDALTVNNSLYLNKTLNPELVFKTGTTQRGNLRVYTGSDSGICFQLWQNGNGINEVFQLPITSLTSGSSTTYYNILTTKDYLISADSSPDLGSSSSIQINGVIIEYGITGAINVDKDSIQTYTLNFKNEFSKAPFIIATRFHNHSDTNNKKVQTHTTVWTKNVQPGYANIALADDGGYGGSAVRITYIAIGNKK